MITNNHDSQKVLATVALAVYRFLEDHPRCVVYAIGGTRARTRLYRMGIGNNFNEIAQNFDVFGFVGNGWEPFEKDKDYEAFLVKIKIINLHI